MEETAPSTRSGLGLRIETRRKVKQYRVLLLMLIPGILYYVIFHYLPMYGVVLAFKEFKITKGILDSPWVGFDVFMKVFSDDYFFTVLKNTLIISLYKLIFGFPVPILFALLLSEIASARFKKLVQTVSYLPHFISWVVMAGIFFHGLLFRGTRKYNHTVFWNGTGTILGG
ncbi:hypothetical protein [Paenibacillus sp. DMB20]|uniref:hypothetical protein n=1 Tax=Paenibacillus sp. DMB20 TaxID=1642570 RepID=UPI000A6CE5C2|nr:hypothetical protein [Paenibacillus sp. DMB20]